MKVLFISSGNSSFGVVPFIKSQGESIKKYCVDIEYFTVKGKGFWGYLANILILKNKIKKDRYDLIHAHYGFCGWISILSTLGTKTPIIISFMGCDVYGDVDLKGKRTLSSYINIATSKLLPLFVNRIIVKSKYLYDQVIFKEKTSIIPNGVNLNLFKPGNKKLIREELNLPISKKIILFLGNPNDPRKNILLLKKAVKYINNSDVELLSPYPISPSEVSKYLNAADVCVLSSYLEGSPNVIKEAMACNCPIVSTDVGDVSWVIGDTRGCYVTSFYPADIAKKLEIALEFSEMNGRTSGRERVFALGLDSETVAKRILEVYEKAMRNGRV